MQVIAKILDVKLNKYVKYMIYLFIILNYFFLMAIITLVNNLNMSTVPLFFLEFECSAFCGTLTTVLMASLVMLSVFYYKKGFIAASVLYAIYILYTAIAASKIGDSSALTGLLMMSIGYITCVIIYHNIKKLKSQNELLQKQKNMLNEMAYFDSLTKLPNRYRILSELNAVTKQCNPAKDTFSIIRIDIDNYRILRDYLGHVKGEEELKIFSNRLNTAIHPLDIPGRMDSDEFIVLVERPLNKEALKDYVLSLQQKLSHKITLNENSFYLNVSYGISIFPDHGTDTEELLQYADTACFEAKKDPDHHICFFNHDLYHQLIHKTTIENALKEAIPNNEFYLVFQPQYSCLEKKLRGFEVLLRWNNEALGNISPTQFIPIAEETGSILAIGGWVLETACETFSAILKQYQTRLILSINISAVQMLENSFLETVTTILEKTGFPAELLEFEITETVLISSKETVIHILNELKRMGIHIALDDFGTEYASLSYLKLLPLDILKIDRSFIHDIGKDTSGNLVEAILTIAKQQSLITVAEGIETQGQLSYLRKKGCQYIQGFLWGKPITHAEVEGLLDQLKEQENLPN